VDSVTTTNLTRVEDRSFQEKKRNLVESVRTWIWTHPLMLSTFGLLAWLYLAPE